MTDENTPPKFSEKSVDDLIASHGREPSKKDMGMIEAMIEKERFRQEVNSKLKETKKARKLDRAKGRQQ